MTRLEVSGGNEISSAIGLRYLINSYVIFFESSQGVDVILCAGKRKCMADFLSCRLHSAAALMILNATAEVRSAFLNSKIKACV